MSRIEVQEAIVDKLGKVDDSMLLAVRSMLDTYLEFQVKGGGSGLQDYDVFGNPADRDTVIEEMENINDMIDAGREEATPLKNVQQRIEKWLEASK